MTEERDERMTKSRRGLFEFLKGRVTALAVS